MRLKAQNYGFESSLPEVQVESKIQQSAKLFQILSDGIYKDKILSVVREVSSNAYDAHVRSGKRDVPFKIKMPSKLEPTFYVEDEGTGIDPAQFQDIYFTYGASTKTDSNDEIGALGLGCKSPLAYTKSSFIVRNRWNGKEYTYLLFINERGIPAYSVVDQAETDKKNGVTVEFAVRLHDIDAFFERTDRFFKYWDRKPIFVGQDTNDVVTTKVDRVLSGTGWFVERRDYYANYKGAVAIQGGVPYPIDISSIPNLPESLRILASNAFVITFDMGTLSFTSSREELSYDESTVKNILSRLEEVRTELSKTYEDKVFKKGQTQIGFIRNFSKTLDSFSEVCGRDHDTEYYVKLLLNKSPGDVVSYGGKKYKIEDLIDRNVSFRAEGHQKFGLYVPAFRGRSSSRFNLAAHTLISYDPKGKVDGKDVFPAAKPGSVDKRELGLDYLHKSSVRNYQIDWRPAIVNSRVKSRGQFDYILLSEKLFEVKTFNRVKLTDDGDFTIVINDLGAVGNDRLKAYFNAHHSVDLYVNFDKDTTLDEVTREVNDFVAKHMGGAKIKKISELPDLRTPVSKVKPEAGTIKLRSKLIICGKNVTTLSVGDVEVKTKDVNVGSQEERVEKIDVLKALTMVPYVMRRRSAKDLYDPIGDKGQVERTVLQDPRYISASVSVGLLDDLFIENFETKKDGTKVFKNKSVEVLIINEGQRDWLLKRKVNLIPLRTLLSDRIKDLQTKENFTANVEHHNALKNVELLTRLTHNIRHVGMGEILKRIQNIGNSYLKKLLNEKLTAMANEAAIANDLLKTYLLRRVADVDLDDHKESAKIEREIHKQYPMMEFFSGYGNKTNMEKAMDYVEMMDERV